MILVISTLIAICLALSLHAAGAPAGLILLVIVVDQAIGIMWKIDSTQRANRWSDYDV